MDKIETKYTQNAICPHCGYEEIDSWELNEDEYDCSFCSKLFVVVRHVDVTYLTYKAKSGGSEE